MTGAFDPVIVENRHDVPEGPLIHTMESATLEEDSDRVMPLETARRIPDSHFCMLCFPDGESATRGEQHE